MDTHAEDCQLLRHPDERHCSCGYWDQEARRDSLASKIEQLIELLKQLPGDADGYRHVQLGCSVSQADLDALAKLPGMYRHSGTHKDGAICHSVYFSLGSIHIGAQRTEAVTQVVAPAVAPAPAPAPTPDPPKQEEPSDLSLRFSLLEVN